MAFTPRTETYVNVSSLTTPFDITVTKPTGTADGDILFCWIGFNDAPIDSVPSGWTLLGQYIVNADKYALYYKIASGEPASWVWSFEYSAKVRAVCSCYTGGNFNPASPIDIVSNTGYRINDAYVIAASMNVAAANSPLVFWAGVYHIAAKTFTKPSVPTTGWVEDDDAGSTTPDFWTEVCSMIWGGSGATGNMSATCSASVGAKHAFAVALKPAAANEFVYSGNVPMTALPGYTSILDRVYSGAMSLLAVPSYQSALDRVYAGSVSLSALPASLTGMEKGYEGSVAMMLSPSYVAALERAYQGAVDMALSPSYLSVLERAYQGQVGLSLLPAYALMVDRLYGGDVPLGILPGYQASMEKGYEGSIPVALSPSYSSILDRLYASQLAMTVMPSALYSLEGMTEFAYLGSLFLGLLPAHVLVMDRLYSGDMPFGLLPGYESALEKGYEGAVALGLAPSHSLAVDRVYGGDVGLSFLPAYMAALEKAYEGSVQIAITPAAIYFLEQVLEHIYVGNVILFITPSHMAEFHGLLRWMYDWEDGRRHDG